MDGERRNRASQYIKSVFPMLAKVLVEAGRTREERRPAVALAEDRGSPAFVLRWFYCLCACLWSCCASSACHRHPARVSIHSRISAPVRRTPSLDRRSSRGAWKERETRGHPQLHVMPCCNLLHPIHTLACLPCSCSPSCVAHARAGRLFLVHPGDGVID